MKQCRICKESKPLSDYTSHACTKDKLHPYCRACFAEYQRERRKLNLAHARDRERRYRMQNVEAYRARSVAKNKKIRATPVGKLMLNVRSYLSQSLKRAGAGKRSRTFSALGYSVVDLKKHLESKFEPGMSWDNYGAWHIDHVKPLTRFNYSSTDDPEFKAAWALSNLQPLWAEHNLSKGGR